MHPSPQVVVQRNKRGRVSSPRHRDQLQRRKEWEEFARCCSLDLVAWSADSVLPAIVHVARRRKRSLRKASPISRQNVKEVYFPFNIYNQVIDPATLDADAEWLKQHPDAHLWIQGYADIRGDIVYNLVLSYHRAQW